MCNQLSNPIKREDEKGIGIFECTTCNQKFRYIFSLFFSYLAAYLTFLRKINTLYYFNIFLANTFFLSATNDNNLFNSFTGSDFK